MEQEIKLHVVYTTSEAEKLLKVSNSTLKRLLKKGLLRANKVGGQYRILGKELLRLVSPSVEQNATQKYMHIKKKTIEKINKW